MIPCAAMERLEQRALLTPILNSLPGADHTIYLDFDGQEVRGTSWNSVYNNGNPISVAGFGYDDETITRIWTRVAEDFIPFNINVTTVEPPILDLIKISGPVTDTKWGIRVIVTPDQSWLIDNVGFTVGGVAYVGSFNWNSDTPCWSFNAGEYAAAETISHEAGHTLGLSHDGVVGSTYYYGDRGVAPIMGAGWGQPISRWSKGEYPGATQLQDDLAIIVGQNGFGYRQDNNDMRLIVEGSPVSGIIETNDDSDSVYFTTDTFSQLSINVTKSLGTNLTEQIRLFRDGGGEIKDWSVLAPGTYIITIDGVAGGYYSDYGSLGQYSISIDVEPRRVIKALAEHAGVWVDVTDRVISWRTTTVRLFFENRVEHYDVAPEQSGQLILLGDVNGDRRVNLIDALFQRGRNGTQNPWADTDGDGWVDLEDALLLRGLNGNTI